MNPLSRFGRSGTAAPDPRSETEAILLAVHEAMDKASDFVPAGPKIREQHFGFGVRPQTVAPVAVAPRAPSLLQKLGLRKKARTGNAEYAGTRIVQPATAETVATGNSSAEESEVLKRLFGDTATGTIGIAKPTVRPAIPRAAAAKRKLDRGDITLAALGVTLGLICALFPWYIFFNQEQFGVREFVFEGGRSGTPARSVGYQPHMIGKPFSTGEMPKIGLDFFPTATLSEEAEAGRAVPASEQPFPLDIVNYKLVHVANGRAMIEDSDGLWVVQPGSRLPDASRVVSLERRDGSWVMVTSLNQVIALEN